MSGEDRVARPMLAAELEKRLRAFVRGECEYAVALGMPREHIECACANRAGRSEDRNIHDAIQRASTAASGKVDVVLSMRSRMPPCPSRSTPLSFTSECRL